MAQAKFEYTEPHTLVVTKALIRSTLAEVRDQLLAHRINGGDRKLEMDTVCDSRPRTCGMAACIGGWASIFLLGYEKRGIDGGRDNNVSRLFDVMEKVADGVDPYGFTKRGRLHALFYDYQRTDEYNEPNVAATAIQRYLNGKDPWPEGKMPNVLPYTKAAPKKKAK